MHQLITVCMRREHRQLGDLSVDRHPLAEDLHFPIAFQQLAPAGAGGLESGEQQGIAVITAVVFAVRPYTSWSFAVSLGLLAVTLIIMLALAMAFKDLRDRRQLSVAGEV